MADFDEASRELWQHIRLGTAFAQPPPDTGPYRADFYNTEKDGGLKFDQLIRFLTGSYRDSSLVFNWQNYAAPATYTSTRAPDGEGGFIERVRITDHHVPFTYRNERQEKVVSALSVKLNKRKDYLEYYWAYVLALEPQKKQLAAILCFYYDNTAQYRSKVVDVLEPHKFKIEEKYIAVQLTTTNLSDFYGLVKTISNNSSDLQFVANQLAWHFSKHINAATQAVTLKFLYERIPDFIISELRSHVDFKLAVSHLHLLKSYDDSGWFSILKDSSGAVINLLRLIGNSQQLYKLFLDDPLLLVELYQNMDGVSTVADVSEQNRQLLADLMLVLCTTTSYEGIKSSGAVFRIGKDYKVYSRIHPFGAAPKDRFFLQQMQRQKDKKLERYPDDIPRLSSGKEVDTAYFMESDSGTYHHPLEAVFLVDMDSQDQTIYTVPAIYVKAMADEGVWKDVVLGLRLGGNLLAVVLGVASLGTSSALLLAVAVADITLATTDILVVIAEDELMKTQEGQEFLRNWNAIQPLLLMGTSAPLMARSALTLIDNTFSTGAKLLAKATAPATKNFLRASLLKMVLEKNIVNFTTSSLQIIDDGYGVYQATFSVIKIREATRLQQLGVLFIKGEMTTGKTTKSGLLVVYKGEIIASGEAKAVRKSLEEVWKVQGAKLVEALEGQLVLKKIDEAIAKLGISIRIPKNTLSVFESERKIRQIIYALKNKIPPKVFDPNKKALQDLGIKLPRSKNGLSVDFEGTPYLYPITANQKNIVKIKMTGSRRLDGKLANRLAGFESQPTNFTWHHLDDYDPFTNTCTMQLVKDKIHIKCNPHYGGVEVVKQYFSNKKIYKTRTNNLN